MCDTCGCGEAPVHDHDRTLVLEEKVLGRNDEFAAHNRAEFDARGIVAVNLMSSPGAGKTTLLERTARDLAGRLALSVIEGDQETARDAGRISSAGCQGVQVNTGVGCHLDAGMVADALHVGVKRGDLHAGTRSLAVSCTRLPPDRSSPSISR